MSRRGEWNCSEIERRITKSAVGLESAQGKLNGRRWQSGITKLTVGIEREHGGDKTIVGGKGEQEKQKKTHSRRNENCAIRKNNVKRQNG